MEVRRLFDVLHYQKATHPQAVALATMKNGDWWKIGTDDLIYVEQHEFRFIEIRHPKRR